LVVCGGGSQSVPMGQRCPLLVRDHHNARLPCETAPEACIHPMLPSNASIAWSRGICLEIALALCRCEPSRFMAKRERCALRLRLLSVAGTTLYSSMSASRSTMCELFSKAMAALARRRPPRCSLRLRRRWRGNLSTNHVVNGLRIVRAELHLSVVTDT